MVTLLVSLECYPISPLSCVYDLVVSTPAWEQAWALSKSDSAESIREIADRTLGELARIHASLGDLDRLGALIEEAKGRETHGLGGRLFVGACQSYGLMRAYPEEGYRCGPLSLANIYRLKNPGKMLPEEIDGYKSTLSGTSLGQVYSWARKLNLGYQIAFRDPGADVLVPSIVHWKVGHFAALRSGGNDDFVTEDSTFGLNNVVTKSVLDSEASGYFLVPEGRIPKGWRRVDDAEAEKVFGKGQATPAQDEPPQGVIPTAGGDSGSTCQAPAPPDGMTTYRFDPTSASLLMSDLPIGYAPPVGRRIDFVATYSSREPSAQSSVTNLGEGWTSNWISYLSSPSNLPAGTVIQYGPGGGDLAHQGLNQATGYFAPQLLSQDRLQQVAVGSFVLNHSDGSSDSYTLNDASHNTYRTSSTDKMGNKTLFGYDSNFRLVTVTDAIGGVSNIAYQSDVPGSGSTFYEIKSIQDPSQRVASFAYNSSHQLTAITDTLGIKSIFSYTHNAVFGDVVTSLNTPYGVTQFSYYGNNIGTIGLQAQDPMGGQERIEWDLVVDPNAISDIANPTTFSVPSNLVPSGFSNVNLVYRNSFFWSKKAMMVAPGNYNAAFLYHWLHDAASGNSATGYIPESTKAPLENRIWYAYDGQIGTVFEGNSSKPSRISRILDDGTESNYYVQYNAAGNVTQTIDPVGRTAFFNYDPNNLNDLLNVKIQNGSDQDLLDSFAYNNIHLPVTITDASGQTTHLSYNNFGELLSSTNAKGETTALSYDGNGYLQNITGPITGSITSFTYGAASRVASITDSVGYKEAFSYDLAGRVTRTDFPDGTYTQTIYNQLDPEWTRDRLGRWTLSQYDALRHLVVVQDPLLRLTLFEHCTCGALIGFSDPNGNRTSYSRDLQERLTRKTFPDGTHVDYSYENSTSRLRNQTDALGQIKTFTYNSDDSLANVSFANAVVPTSSVTFSYDQAYPRIISMVDGVGTTTYTYNPVTASASVGASRLASVKGFLANSRIDYTYDELGRITKRSINGDANSTESQFDALDRIVSIINPLGAFAFGYSDQTTRLSSIHLPNGQSTNFAYYPNIVSDGTGNDDERLQSIQNINADGSNLSSFEYTYDAAGNIGTLVRQSSDGGAALSKYTYDAANQLIAALVPNQVSGVAHAIYYTFDLSGNRSQLQDNASINSFVFSSSNALVSESSGGNMMFAGSVSEPATMTIGSNPASVDSFNNWSGSAPVSNGSNSIQVAAKDGAGNVTTKTINVTVSGSASRSLSYDANGNLLDNGAGQTYKWDANNRLVSITQLSGVTGFTYDGYGRRVQETLNGAIVKQWVWSGLTLEEERDVHNNITKRFFAQGEQIGGQSYYFTRDNLGSVREMTDAGGAIRARYDYDPSGISGKVAGDLGSDFGFTGMYVHSISGLNLAVFRAYDPTNGRWLSRDRLGERGGFNLYNYVDNNPITFVDPLGLFHLVPSSTGAPQDGSNGVVSNGNGGLSVFYGKNPAGESQIVLNSIAIHELNHIKDAYNQNSAIANDAPADEVLAPDTFDEQLRTEIDALNAQLTYLRHAVADPNISCYDKQRVQNEISFASNLLKIAYDRYDAATPEQLLGSPKKIWP